MEKLIQHFAEKQKTLFLVDSIGAFITAFFLFVIIQQLNFYFGIPKTQLTYLLIIAICFCIYSVSCFLLLKRRFAPFMRFIGIANILYCVVTIGTLIKYYHLVTLIGTSFFLIEIGIIFTLSYVELTVAKRIKEKSF